MGKDLIPIPKSRNPQQLQQRLEMLANGWTPIPCEAKELMLKGWTTVRVDEEQLRLWDSYEKDAEGKPKGCKFKGTGIRLAGDILVVDLDIHDADLMNEVLDALEARFPDWVHGAIWRNSGAISWALFGRVSEPIKSRPHRVYGRVAADGTITDKAHCEIHGGLSKRYFAVAGPHKETGREYHCDGPAPWDTRLDSLPVLPVGEVGPLLDCVEEVLARHLDVIDENKMDMVGSVYDLTTETLFETEHGDRVILGELESWLEAGTSGIRGVLEMDWGKSESGSRHHAFIRDNNNRLMVTDHYRGVNHYWADEAPGAAFELPPEAAAAIEALRVGAPAEGVEQRQQREALDDIPRDDTDPVKTYATAAAWLLLNVAWYAQAFKGHGGCVSIDADGEFQAPVTLTSLKSSLSKYGYQTKNRNGTLKWCNPVAAWETHEKQLGVYGVRMRPELPRPLFNEDGLVYVNRYLSPTHPSTGGSIAVFERRMVVLLPNPIERIWTWNWLACLIQHPEWRMVALAMIAHEHGSGRGLLAETLQRVLGERFVISLPYDSVTGGSRFNAEVEGKLLVYVNEARHADANRYGFKMASREALKVFIEPNHRIPQRIEPKGVDAYYTRLAISTLIFANSIKAVPIDDQDRRAAVVMNGPQMTAAEIAEYRAWMENPANIGALYRHLRDWKVETDKTVFDPYMSPHFVGRDLMIAANKSAIDIAWEAAVNRFKAAGAELYAMNQVIGLATHIAKSTHGDFGDLIRSHTFEHGHRIGIKRPSEKNWLVRYGSGEDNRQAVFAFDPVAARKWTHAESHVIKAELDKAQQVVEAPSKALNKILKLVIPTGDDE